MDINNLITNSIFNPVAPNYNSVSDFRDLSIQNRMITIFLTFLATVASLPILGLGGVAAFRVLVNNFSAKKLAKGDDPKVDKVTDVAIKMIDPSKTKKDILEFINRNYQVKYKSPSLENIEDAEIFLLDDLTEEQRRLNCLFIDSFAEEGSALMLESVPANEEVATLHLQDKYLKKPIKRVGWDLSDKELHHFTDKGAQLFAKTLELSCKKQLLLDLNKAVEAQRLRDKIVALTEELLALEPEFVPNLHEHMVQSHPKRAQKLMETLIKQETEAGPGKRLFLIAGSKHLFKIQPSLGNDIHINTLHDFLKSRKAVILSSEKN